MSSSPDRTSLFGHDARYPNMRGSDGGGLLATRRPVLARAERCGSLGLSSVSATTDGIRRVTGRDTTSERMVEWTSISSAPTSGPRAFPTSSSSGCARMCPCTGTLPTTPPSLTSGRSPGIPTCSRSVGTSTGSRRSVAGCSSTIRPTRNVNCSARSSRPTGRSTPGYGASSTGASPRDRWPSSGPPIGGRCAASWPARSSTGPSTGSPRWPPPCPPTPSLSCSGSPPRTVPRSPPGRTPSRAPTIPSSP